MLQPGDSLAGYRIEAVAGVGGMGVVYRAVQTSLDRPVALKVLSSTLVGNRTFRERFRREGRHAAALDHPNIIPVYEAGESNGLMFIAMRLVDGPSLADLIDQRQLSGREALRVVGAIAGALDAAHDGGLVHRDIKPQNILLTRLGHPYLADFGITKGSDHDGLTHSGDFVGSLNYVAPEQIEGIDVSGASDVYALTAVLFQALSGRHPYQRDNDAALMHAHLTAPPPTFSERGIDVPPALDAVIQRGMAKVPADRFQTAGALMEACRAALAGVDDARLGERPAFAPPGAPDPEPPAPAGADTTTADAPAWLDAPAAAGNTTQVIAAATGPNATTVDALRGAPRPEPVAAQPAASAAQPRTRRPLPAWLGPAAAGVLLLAAAIGGSVIGHEPAPPGPTRADAAAVQLTHGTSWTTSTGSIDGLKVAGGLSLRSTTGVKLVAGRLTSARSSFTPTPKGLADRLAPDPEVATVRLGGRQVTRLRGTLRTGDELWAAYAPDTKGWTGVVCEGPSAQTLCPAVAVTLQTPGAEPVRVGPRADTITAVGAALTQLGRARTRAEGGLGSKILAVRASAASTLASAQSKAATSIRRAPDAWEAKWIPSLRELAGALEQQASALTRMASAARGKDRRRYTLARDALQRREQPARAAIDQLTELGYLEG